MQDQVHSSGLYTKHCRKSSGSRTSYDTKDAVGDKIYHILEQQCERMSAVVLCLRDHRASKRNMSHRTRANRVEMTSTADVRTRTAMSLEE